MRIRLLARSAFLFLIAAILWAAGPGFRTQRDLDAHYQKHGHEFGGITKAEYLRLAQELRDSPVGGPILEAVRKDGVITRFDRERGHFGAYNENGTIRTFFIPAAGERYFRRQAARPPSRNSRSPGAR
jgi:pyocin large subunit-like protein